MKNPPEPTHEEQQAIKALTSYANGNKQHLTSDDAQTLLNAYTTYRGHTETLYRLLAILAKNFNPNPDNPYNV